MKKIVIIAVATFVAGSALADCFYQETEPRCAITGETYTSTCDGWSDTSSWSIPDAYPGVCDDTPDLSEYHKGRIVASMDAYFRKFMYYGPMYESKFDVTSKNLNLKGQAFVRDKFFPALKVAILEARSMDDLQSPYTIAMLNYGAKVIGYDYYISAPQ